MKKKQKPKQAAPKEFAATPFQALRGVSVEKAATSVKPPPKKEPEPAPQEVDDAALFLSAFADVKRLHPTVAKAPAKGAPPAAPPSLETEEERVFLQAVASLKMDVRFSDDTSEETLVRPAPVNRLRQLRRGGIRIDLQLDLHGLTRDEAIENLERFVKGAYGRGQKGVLVITGKGNHSPGEPVLKQAVTLWLRGAGKDMVAEFVTAPSDMGGGGAIVVFLKGKKSAPEQEQ